MNSWDFMFQKLFAEQLTKKTQRPTSLKTFLCDQEINL